MTTYEKLMINRYGPYKLLMGTCQCCVNDTISDFHLGSKLYVPESHKPNIFPVNGSSSESEYESMADLSLPPWSNGNSIRSTPKSDIFKEIGEKLNEIIAVDVSSNTLEVPKSRFS